MATGENLVIGSEPIDHLALSVDTSQLDTAHSLMSDFAEAGGSVAKLGLELQSVAGGPEGLSRIAQEHGLKWVYDGKLKDIGNTMVKAVTNIVSYDYPPVAITMHADTSFKAMHDLQEAAGGVTILGVTLLTDIGPEEAYADYATAEEKELTEAVRGSIEGAGELVRIRVVLERAVKLGKAGVRGLVASSKELSALAENDVTANAIKMIPGTRSQHAQANDQMNVMTPEDAITLGADLLVIGRQYTGAKNKPKELALLVDEVARGLERRATQQN